MTFLRPSRFVLLGALSFSVFLTSCFGGGVDLGEHTSKQGLIPEEYMPADLGMILSFSLQNDEQFEALQNLEEKLGKEGQLTEAATESFNEQFSQVGLDYERDLLPALGEQFRWVYGARPEGDSAAIFSVTTLEDAEQLVTVFETLVEAAAFSKKILSDRDVYVSADENFYATIEKDLLLVSDDPEQLVSMLDLDGESLWNADLYVDAMEEVGQDFVFYGFLFPAFYSQDLALGAGLGVSGIPAAIERQSLLVRAEEDGLSFDLKMQADEEKAKAAGISFDSTPKSKPYLFEEMPSEGLMAYFESFGLAQTLAQADKLGDDTNTLSSLRETFRNYFGMDFDEDFMSWFDKGYTLAFHQNEAGLMPGITIFVDSSSDEVHAKELIDKVEAQLSGLVTVFEEALPGAVDRSTVQVQGEEFTKFSLDLTSVPRADGSPLPTLVTSSEIQVIFGVLDGRVLISTATVWEEEDFETITESVLYSNMKGQIDGVDQGLVLVDADGLAKFVASLRALREQLGLEVSTPMVEFEDFLDGFEGAIAQSKTDAYSSTFSGYLLLEE